jgi:hypothetical protein
MTTHEIGQTILLVVGGLGVAIGMIIAGVKIGERLLGDSEGILIGGLAGWLSFLALCGIALVLL